MQTVDELFDTIDKDRSGEIDYKELVKVTSAVLTASQPPPHHSIHQASTLNPFQSLSSAN